MFKKQPIDKNFVSSIDKALAKFNRTHPLTEAQRAEVDKYRRIYRMRDHAIAPKKDKDLWDFDS